MNEYTPNWIRNLHKIGLQASARIDRTLGPESLVHDII